ncbi:hypothetical protein Tco_0316316 [Tanacetum coccineum]
MNSFPTSDAKSRFGMSQIAVDPDSDDEVLAEILFRGKYISGAGVVTVDKLPDDEIIDPRVKVETVSAYASSPPRSRRKHRGVRSDDFLWDKPVEDFFSSESESDDDMEHYIPPLPYGEFKDWEMVSCPPGNNHIHVYYQQNRRRKYFTYLRELLPHVYREDLLLLRRRMNRYFRLNPDVDIGLDLWRDVNMLCQSLHSDDVEDFWLLALHDKLVFSSPWLTSKKSLASPFANGFVCNSNPLIAENWTGRCDTRVFVSPKYHLAPRVSTIWKGLIKSTLASDSCKDWKLLFFDVATSFDSAVHRVHAVSIDAADLDVASTVSAACIVAAGYIVSAGICDAAGSFVLADLIYICCLLCFCCYSILLLREDLSRNLELTESKPIVPAGSSSSVPADYVSAGHVLVSADRDRIC